MPELRFGATLRMLRQRERLTIRHVASAARIDYSNYAKVERGTLPPPGDDVVQRIGIALGFDVGVDRRWIKLRYTGDIERGEIPREILANDDATAVLTEILCRLREQYVEGDGALNTSQYVSEKSRAHFDHDRWNLVNWRDAGGADEE